MSHPIRRPGERGAFLLAVLVLAVVLGGLSLAFLQESLAERTSLRHHETSLLALEIAETGLAHAEMEIRALEDPGDDGIGTVARPYGGGLYEVSAQRDPAYPDRWALHARGEHELSTRNIEVVVRRREEGYFVEGLFSLGQLTLGGSVTTDSYDSRSGLWVDQAVNMDAGGPYAKGGGHIGSNEGIDLSGTAIHVRGNAIPGPLFRTEISGQSEVWGDTVPRRRELELLPPPLEDFEAALASKDNDQLIAPGDKGKGGGTGPYDMNTMSLNATGQTEVVLAGGTYFFTDITLSGGASLVIQGPTRIYVTGNVDLTGGSLVNQTGKPTDCLVFAHGYPLPDGFQAKTPAVKLNGGPQVALGLYAPYRDVTVGGDVDVFGSVIGGSVNVTGDASFHYDEALKGVSGGTEVYLERLYWRDADSPRR